MSHPSRIRILLAVPKADDPTSFYRAYGPLAGLGHHVDVRPMMPSSYSHATISMNDVVCLQRPADPSCLQIAEQAKICQVPLWVDFDDDNLAVPKSNPTYAAFYSRWDVKDTIVKCARLADVVTVSTEALRKKYSVYNKNTILIPNAIDERYLRIRELTIPKRKRDKVIAWRGGPGFEANIEEVVPSVIELAKKYPTWKFMFMGNEPIKITEHIKNYQFIPWIDNMLGYLQVICQIHATSWFNCVVPNDHSLARSHGPWLEANFAGSALLAKKMPEMTRPGCLNYETADEFKTRLEAIIKGEVDIEALHQESWQYILDNYTLSRTNVKRKEILEQLLSSGYKPQLICA